MLELRQILVDVLTTGTLFLALGVVLGFCINAKQLMVLAAALFLFAGALGAGQGAARIIFFAMTAAVLLQLGYFLGILGQALLAARPHWAERFPRSRKERPNG